MNAVIKVQNSAEVQKWCDERLEKLEKYKGGGFLGNAKMLYDVGETTTTIVFIAKRPGYYPFWIGLGIAAAIFFFGLWWWLYIFAALLMSVEFFLSSHFLYYTMALSLTKKANVKKYTRGSIEELLVEL